MKSRLRSCVPGSLAFSAIALAMGCTEPPESTPAPTPAAATPETATGDRAGEATGPPSLLLVTLDTVRADHLGVYGANPSPTPTLDGLAARALVFDQALATTPETLPSHASILTGLYPPAHGLRTNGRNVLPETSTLVQEVLAERGWRTAAFVASIVLERRYGLAQGFERYTTPGGALQRAGGKVVGDAIGWLRRLEPEERFFAWVHLYDPHDPYEPPEPHRSRYDDPYTGEIAYADELVGRLLRFLASQGRERNLVVIVTADHGESLGEHGEKTHAVFIYQATMHVPLFVSGPGIAAGRRSEPVSIAQIAPTILALAGIEQDALPEVSLAPLPGLAGPASEPESAIYLESVYPFHSFGFAGLRGIVEGSDKLIAGHRRELYSLSDDPGEREDLAEHQPERSERLAEALRALAARHGPLGESEGAGLSSEDRARLAQLGYIVSDSAEGDPFAAGLPDPRNGLAALAAVQRAIVTADEAISLLHPDPRLGESQNAERRAQGRRQLERLRDELHAQLAANPSNDGARNQLARTEVMLGDRPGAALETLEARRAAMPFDVSTRYLLARAYEQLGRHDEARVEMEKAIELEPRAGYYDWMITHYEERGDRDAALRWAERYVAEVDPRARAHARARLDALHRDAGANASE